MPTLRKGLALAVVFVAAVLFAVSAAAQTLPTPTLTSLTPSQIDVISPCDCSDLFLVPNGTGIISNTTALVWNSPSHGLQSPVTLQTFDFGAGPVTGVGIPLNLLNTAETVTITLQNGTLVSNSVPFVIQPLPVLSPAAGALPATTSGATYSFGFAGSLGVPPYLFALGFDPLSGLQTQLPPGLNLDPNFGTVSGTAPTVSVPTTYPAFIIVLSDNNPSYPTGVTGPQTDSKSYTLTVNPAPVLSGPTTLSAAVEGRAYGPVAYTVSGGTAPYTYAISGGPQGLTFTAGQLQGTPAAGSAGNYPRVQLSVTDAAGVSSVVVAALTVNPPLSLSPAPSGLSPAVELVLYTSAQFTAAGGLPGYTIAFIGLPTWLSSANQILTGVPPAGSANSYPFQVRVTDGGGVALTQNYTLVVNPALGYSPATVPPAAEGTPYGLVTLTGTGGVLPTRLGLADVTQPTITGMSVVASNGTIQISGTPAAGTSLLSPYNFLLQIQDSLGNTTFRNLTITVNVAPATCVATTAVPPVLRAEGMSELVGDIVIDCTGGTPTLNNANVPQTNITVTLNTAVTSRTYNTATPAVSEALLLVDEPRSPGNSNPAYYCGTPAAGGCTFAGLSQSPGVPYSAPGFVTPYCGIGGPAGGLGTPACPGQTPRPNAYAGMVQGNVVTFVGVPIDAPGTNGHRLLRVTNIRANTSGITAPPTGGATVQATVAATSLAINNATNLLVGFVQPGVAFSVKRNDGSGADATANDISRSQCTTVTRNADSPPLNSVILRFQEGFPSAFRLQDVDGDQNVPGQISATESGFYQFSGIANNQAISSSTGATSMQNVGHADSATRLKALITNIPPGVNVYASTTSLSTTAVAYLMTGEGLGQSPAQPTYTDFVCNTAGACTGFAPGSGTQLPVVNGTATAVWEVTNANNASTDNYEFYIWFSYAANPAQNIPPPGTATVTGSFAPTPAGLGVSAGVAASASNTLPVPRFADGTQTRNWLTIVPCASLISILPATLPIGIAGQPYGPVTFTASGGTAPYTFTLTGKLPVDVQFANGVLSGVPNLQSNGSYPVTVQARDAGGNAGSALYTLIVNPGRMFLTTPTLPPGGVSQFYSQQIGISGGLPPYRFALSNGVLPTGLSLSTSGLVSGFPIQAGPFSFTVTVTDSQGKAESLRWPAAVGGRGRGAHLFASANFTVSVTINSPLGIVTTTLPPITPYQPYSSAIVATGGTPPYTFIVLSGTLPPGLSLNPFTGALTGSFTGDGTSTFTVQVNDTAGTSASRIFTLGAPNPPPVILTTSPLPAAVVGSLYNMQFAANAVAGTSRWSLDSGSLPPGFSVTDSGLLSGTASSTGSYSFVIRFTDLAQRSVTKAFTLAVNPALTITTTSPLPDSVNGLVSTTFAATGGVPPYTWTVTTTAAGGPSAVLPGGVSLSSDGVLGGISTVDGNFPFQVTVADSAGNKYMRNFTIHVTQPLALVTTSPLPDGSTDKSYGLTLQAKGGVPPYSWASDALPGGLALSPSNGTISGTPATAGKYSFTLRVTDQKGFSASGPFTLTVNAPPLVILSNAQLPPGTAGSPYTFTFAGQGGVQPFSWSVSTAGLTAAGLSLSPDGSLTGNPQTPGTYSFTVVLTDAQTNFVRKDFTFVVDPAALGIPTTSLPGGVTGSDYTQTLTANGGIPPYTWTADLPPGLTIDPATGTISGSTTATGNVSFTVTVTDSKGVRTTRTYTVNFALPPLPPVTPTGLPSTVGPQQQPSLQLGLSGTYPVDITGTVRMTFAADRGGDDPAVQFSTGGRIVVFTIPAGANLATFPVPSLAVQTGTTAGVITITSAFQAAGTDITSTPAPSQQIRIPPTAPVVTSVQATRSGTQIQVQVIGYSTTREMSQALFHFNAASGASLQTGDVTLPVTSIFAAWYSAPEAATFGGQFTFTQSFTIQGDPAATASVTVTMTNTVGNSQPVTANVQ